MCVAHSRDGPCWICVDVRSLELLDVFTPTNAGSGDVQGVQNPPSKREGEDVRARALCRRLLGERCGAQNAISRNSRSAVPHILTQRNATLQHRQRISTTRARLPPSACPEIHIGILTRKQNTLELTTYPQVGCHSTNSRQIRF